MDFKVYKVKGEVFKLGYKIFQSNLLRLHFNFDFQAFNIVLNAPSTPTILTYITPKFTKTIQVNEEEIDEELPVTVVM